MARYLSDSLHPIAKHTYPSPKLAVPDAVSGTMVYKNGRICTSGSAEEYVSAMVVQNGCFVYIGNDEGTVPFETGLPGNRIVDLKGRLVTPGFLEDLNCFSAFAALKAVHYAPIPDGLCLTEALEALRQHIASHPEYPFYIAGNFSPLLELDAIILDGICSDKPVICIGSGCRCSYVNSRYMEIGRITKDSPDRVPGQSFCVRDSEGNPTGKLVGPAQIWDGFDFVIPFNSDDVKWELRQLVKLYHSYGFVGVAEDGFLGFDENIMLQLLSELEEDGNLNFLICPATVWYGHSVSAPEELVSRALQQKEQHTTRMIRPGTAKMWTGAGAGPCSARPDYSDIPEAADDLNAFTALCKEHGLNARYDMACGGTLDAAIAAIEAAGAATGTRSFAHIENCPAPLPEPAADTGILFACIEPVSDVPGRFRSADSRITICFGSDSFGSPEIPEPVLRIQRSLSLPPVGDAEPSAGPPWTFEDAVRACTINVANERRIDPEHGSIETGKSADYIIWSGSGFPWESVPADGSGTEMVVDPENAVSVREVFFMGKRVYRAKEP